MLSQAGPTQVAPQQERPASAAIRRLPAPHLVHLVSLVGDTAGGVGEHVRLRVLAGPELLLTGPQQLGGFHHVLHILVLVEPVPQEAGEVAVLVPTDRGHAR